MAKFLDKIFGGGNKREVTRLQSIVDRINSFEAEIEKLSDKDLSDKTIEFRELLKSGKTLDDILPEAFAVVREAARREIGQRHFDVQLIGGMVLHQGKIAEMKTGEGKTLVATLALYLNAIEGKGAHLVTVNDYLSKYQGEWMGRVYDRLGLKTGIIQNQGVSFVFERGWGKKNQTEEQAAAGEVLDENLRPSTRKEAYDADITYGTNNEYGFDYLRDNMAQSAEQLVQRAEGLNFAIVDEVDSILIDEARTPLIISSPAEESADLYAKFATIVPNLKRDVDFEIDEKLRAVSLNDAGIEKLEKILGIPNVFQPETISLVHHLEEALKAHALFTKDKDYVVKDGEVVIVDEFTGRMMPGRRYSEGLHQAIEAKEGVAINRESDTLATISFQNFFRLYNKLGGMTGTAATEAEEFHKIYKLDVVEIPTNRDMVRIDLHDQIYKNEDAKFNAIVAKIKELNEKKQPVLIGTISIAKSEVLSKLLKRSGVKHEVLNAKAHEREAKIIAQAGSEGAVTVATNMAGRGVDILLGGNPPKEDEAENVKKTGGLFVIGTERHESRRIDNQLRGRAGRQGDPGGSQFFISMDDDLMRIFGGDRLKGMMDRLGLADDQPIEHSMISKSIESAQRRVEGNNFDTRKHLVEYDDVMNKQREVFYRRRRRILALDPLEDNSLHEQLIAQMSEEESGVYEKNINNSDIKSVRDIERRVSLSIMDQSWIEHLNTMDQLRDSIGLRGYAQVDPLVAYKEESLRLFEGLMRAIDDEILSILTKVDFRQVQTQAPKPKVNPLEYKGADQEDTSEAIQAAINDETTDVAKVEEAVVSEPEQKIISSKTSRDVITTVRTVGERMQQASVQTNSVAGEKIGRNDPCSCGSGKKYKKCCGK
jgi:preprotein translocase subunit SecA